MVVIILLAGVPVYRLTRPALVEATPGASVNEASAELPGAKPAPLEVEVEVAFAPAAVDFQLKNLDQTILAGRGPQVRFHTRWTAPLPSEGVDLVIQARWPPPVTVDDPAGANPAAARVTLSFADGRQVEKSFWATANGTLKEVLTVPGENSVAAP